VLAGGHGFSSLRAVCEFTPKSSIHPAGCVARLSKHLGAKAPHNTLQFLALESRSDLFLPEIWEESGAGEWPLKCFINSISPK
jgi:hypothetical protein